MTHSLSSVVRMKDSGVLSGRGGVRLSSAAQQKIINSNFKFLNIEQEIHFWFLCGRVCYDFTHWYTFSWTDVDRNVCGFPFDYPFDNPKVKIRFHHSVWWAYFEEEVEKPESPEVDSKGRGLKLCLMQDQDKWLVLEISQENTILLKYSYTCKFIITTLMWYIESLWMG